MGKAARNARRAREKRIEDRYVRELAVADAYWDQWYERAEPVVPTYEPPAPKQRTLSRFFRVGRYSSDAF